MCLLRELFPIRKPTNDNTSSLPRTTSSLLKCLSRLSSKLCTCCFPLTISLHLWECSDKHLSLPIFHTDLSSCQFISSLIPLHACIPWDLKWISLVYKRELINQKLTLSDLPRCFGAICLTGNLAIRIYRNICVHYLNPNFCVHASMVYISSWSPANTEKYLCRYILIIPIPVSGFYIKDMNNKQVLQNIIYLLILIYICIDILFWTMLKSHMSFKSAFLFCFIRTK